MNHCKEHYDVIVIGAGATGAGTARDCAMRGTALKDMSSSKLSSWVSWNHVEN